MEFEKFIPKRINKDVDPNSINRSGERLYLPGDCTDALNCQYKRKSGYVVKSPLGNEIRLLSLTGTNKVIGAFVYEKYNTLVYILWNNGVDDKIVEYNPITETFTTLLTGDLNLDKDWYASHGGIIDDILIFTDSKNETCYINILKAKAGFYSSFTSASKSLVAAPPLAPLNAVLVTEAGRTVNKICGNAFQFAYRFIYYDNRKSVLSPYSKIIYSRYMGKNVGFASDNAIDVTIPFDTAFTGLITDIEVLFRLGNDGYFYLIKTISAPSSASYTVRFYNTLTLDTVALTESNKLYDAIPSIVDSLKVANGRVFSTLSEDGFDVDESSFNLSVALADESLSFLPYDIAQNMYLKRGGSYSAGILFSDKFGKTTFVKSKKSVEVPFDYDTVTSDHKYTYRGHYLNWSLSGAPPAGMVKYQLVLTPNNTQLLYHQFRPFVRLYIRDLSAGETDNTFDATTYNWRGRKFRRTDSGATAPGVNDYTQLWFQMPQNMPFIPDTGCIIRFQNDFPNAEKQYNVRNQIDIFLVLNQISLIPWENYQRIDCEVYRPADIAVDKFYEIGEAFNIVNNNFSTVSGKMYGDTYFGFNGGIKDEYDIAALNGEGDVFDLLERFNPNRFYNPTREIITTFVKNINIYSASGYNVPSVTPGNTGVIVLSSDNLITIDNSSTIVKSTYTFDLTKIASNFGRVHTSFDKEKKVDITNVVAYSNIYVQGSQVNGINEFDSANRYTVPIERGKITGFALVGNILVCFHERNVTSLYIGRGTLKEGDNFLLAKTTSVIGDDNPLINKYGTIHPESIFEIFGNVFFWDSYRGAFCKKTNAGLDSVSDSGMRQYFVEKGKAIFKYNHKVITGFDYLTREILLTFSDATDTNGNVIVPGETWGYDIDEEVWTSRYSFVPEMYGSLEMFLSTFKAGQLWAHYKNGIVNTFYGTKFNRKFSFMFNPRVSANKKLLNLYIKGFVAATPDSEFAVVTITNDKGQRSIIPAYEFLLDEDKYIAEVLKDMNSPVAPGQLALRSGDDMVGQTFEITIENDRGDEAPCAEITVIYKTENFSI